MAEKRPLAVRQTNGALRRLDPFEMLNALQREMDGFWRARFRLEELPFHTGRGNDANADFMPRMDVYEQNNTIVVWPNLPYKGPLQLRQLASGERGQRRGVGRARHQCLQHCSTRDSQDIGGNAPQLHIGAFHGLLKPDSDVLLENNRA